MALLTKITGQISRYLSVVAGIALSIVTVLVVFDVIGRYGFDRPLKGTFELVEALIVPAVFCAFAYAHLQQSHVRVDLVFRRLPPRVKWTADVVTGVISISLFSVLGWHMALAGIESWRYGDVIYKLGISPLYLWLTASMGIFALSLQILSQLVLRITETFKRDIIVP